MLTKHHKIMAKIIKDRFPRPHLKNEYNDGRRASLQCIAKDLTVIFAEENPKFSRQQFLDACGL